MGTTPCRTCRRISSGLRSTAWNEACSIDGNCAYMTRPELAYAYARMLTDDLRIMSSSTANFLASVKPNI